MQIKTYVVTLKNGSSYRFYVHFYGHTCEVLRCTLGWVACPTRNNSLLHVIFTWCRDYDIAIAEVASLSTLHKSTCVCFRSQVRIVDYELSGKKNHRTGYTRGGRPCSNCIVMSSDSLLKRHIRSQTSSHPIYSENEVSRAWSKTRSIYIVLSNNGRSKFCFIIASGCDDLMKRS